MLSVQTCELTVVPSRIESSIRRTLRRTLLSDLYSQASLEDTVKTKILVYAVYILQMTQIIIFMDNGFQEFTADFGDIVAFNQFKTNWFSVCVIGGIGVCHMRRNCLNT